MKFLTDLIFLNILMEFFTLNFNGFQNFEFDADFIFFKFEVFVVF
jgi:hypothetical protein